MTKRDYKKLTFDCPCCSFMSRKLKLKVFKRMVATPDLVVYGCKKGHYFTFSHSELTKIGDLRVCEK